MTKIQIQGRKKRVTFIWLYTDEGKFVGELRVAGETMDFNIPSGSMLIVRAVPKVETKP